MDDKKILDTENIIKGLDDDDIKEFEAGEDEEIYDSGRGDAFEVENDVEFFEVNGEMDEYEDEMEQDFEDEMTYSTAGKKKSSFSKFFQLPHISAGWLGVLLVVLILLFLFLPRSSRKPDTGEMAAINSRLTSIEGQMIHLESLSKRVDLLSLDLQKQKQVETRMNEFEKTLAAVSNQLQEELKELKSKSISSPPPKIIEAPEVKKVVKPAEKTVAKKTEVKYHIVKKGENLYRIALGYGLTEAQLIKLNNMEPNAIIYPGQKIKVSK